MVVVHVGNALSMYIPHIFSARFKRKGFLVFQIDGTELNLMVYGDGDESYSIS